MDGLISFFASHYALRAETTLKRNALPAQPVPAPRDRSPNCGVALRFEYAQRETVLAMLAVRRVQVDGVHHYRPRTDEWNTSASSGG